MEVRCPNCGTENPERAKFCLECGTALAGAAEAGSRESRRVVTVVFADMVGFTSLGERLDQESLRRVMDRFYGEMRAAIEGQGGTLAKFIGDAVLAVWGTPEVREDDALRAVRAAEAMRGALAGLNSDLESRWGVHVGMRTGVNTGEVVVDPSRPADLLVGDTLNVAARLEQAAADGEVLIGADTFHLVRDEAILEPVEPLALKGKSRPLPAWRLVDGLRGDRRAAPRLQAPLVGREAELDRLRASLAEVVEGRSARMVTVIGSPGLGKTRLVAEFVRSLEGEATVLEGRCEASGEGITFQPVAEVLRAAASIGDEDAPEVAREKLATVLAEDEPQRDRIVDRTATLLGLAPLASTEETFWAMRRLLESLARRRPVVLVHDDIHWGQPTFLDLLEHLVAWVRDAPLLIVALARPELREVRPGLAEPGAVVSDVLALEPLAPDASRTLATRLLGDANLPAGLAERVLETTEGNPLFLGEMLRMLADEGVLRREGERWVAARDTAGIAVPPTIQALLAARIERLAGDERSVVERAAVIGHQFYRGAVAELAPPAVRPKVDMALDTLRRKDLVRPEDFLWLDEKVFRFHHVLIRDAAYRSLLKEARAELHERFADWLEVKAGDVAGEHEEVIAFHLEQAYSYRLELGALDEHGRALAERAAGRLRSAGRRALAREDLPAAINLLRRALAPIAADDPRLPDVRVDLAEALLSAGDTAEAEPVIEEIGLAADEYGDERLGAWATVFLGQLDNLTGAGHVRESLEAVTEAAEILARVGDRAGEAKAHQVIAAAEGQLGQVAAAEAALDRALVAARAADDRRRITAVLSGAPRAALWGPAPIVRASGRCLDVVRILRMTPGNRHVEAAALRCQAVLEAMRGRSDAARGILDSCRITFEELGLTLELQETDVHAGIVELLAGDAAAAEEPLRAAQEGFTALGAHGGAAQAAALLARALLEQGREDEAFDATRVAEDHGGEDLKTTIAWLGVRAEALARRGDEHEALILARRGAELAEPTDALADKADALMALAAVELAARDVDAARAAARRARDLYAEKDHAVGVARAEAVAGASSAPAPAPEDQPEWSPRTPAEHVHAAWQDAFNRRDWQGLRETFADDLRFVGGRSLAEDGADDAEGAVALMHSVVGDADTRLSFRPLAVSDEVVAGIDVWRATGPGGSPSEVLQGIVHVVVDGRIAYAESFDADDELGILRRFEALRAEHAPTEAARGLGSYTSRYNEGADITEAFTDDIVAVDHRNVGWESFDRAGMVELNVSFKAISPDSVVAYTRTLATDDSRFAGLLTGVGTSPDGGQIEMLIGQVLSVRDGQIASADFFEPTEEAAMLARFEELGVGSREVATPTAADAKPAPLRFYDAFCRAYNERDWEALRGLFPHDVVQIDRRQIGWENVQGGDDIVELMRSLADGVPGSRVRVDRVLRVTDELVAMVLVGSGTSEVGSEAEIAVGQVEIFVDGASVLCELFDPDDDDGILARYAELTAPGPRPIHPAGRVFAERMARAFNARDWDGYDALLSGDILVRDRRAATRAEHHGIDEFLLLMRGVVRAVEDAELRTETIAAEILPGGVLIQADRQVYGRAGRDVRAGVVGVRRDGRMFRADILDDDPAALLAHYDAVKAELLAERPQPSAQLPPGLATAFAAWVEAFNAEDWDRLAQFYAPDVAHIDHRPGIRDNHYGIDGVVELFKALSASASETVVEWDPIVLRSPRLVASRMTVRAVGEHQVEFGHIFDHVLVLDESGLVRLIEVFQPEQRDELLRRLDELDGRPAVAFDGRTTAGLDALVAAVRRHDWARLARNWAPDVAAVDRRRGMRVDFAGVDGFLSTWRSLAEYGGSFELDWEPIEQRAEWLFAFRMRMWGTGLHGERWEADFDQIGVNGPDGRGVHFEIFDADDPQLRTRLDELEREGPPPPLAARQARRFLEAFNSHDWDALQAMFVPDVVSVDHRTLASENDVQDRPGMVGNLRSLIGLGPDLNWRDEMVAMRGERHCMLRFVIAGHDERGGPWEIPAIRVAELDEHGLTTRVEIFAVDDEAAARARLDELARPHALTLGPLAEPGPATATGALWVAALNAHDLDAIAALLAESYHYEDRRPGIAHVGDREATIESWRSSFEALPDLRVDAVALAAEGRYCITAERWTAADGAHEIGVLTVAEIDEEGLRAAWVHEPGDPAAWELYAELTEGPVRLVSTASGTWSIVERDEEGHVVHRYGSAPDGGGPVELRIHNLTRMRDGQMVYGEVFDSPEEAVAALDLMRDRKPLVREVGDRWTDAFRARDFEAAAKLYAPDAVFVDHRPVGGPATHGEQAMVETLSTLVELATDAVHEGDPMTTVGEYHGLGRNGFRGTHEHGGEWVLELLTLIEVSPQGQITRVELFTDEQAAEARARLAEMTALTPSLGCLPKDPETAKAWWPHVKHLRAMCEAFNHVDLDRLRELIDEDFRQVDYRPLGADPTDREGFVQMVATGREYMPGVTIGFTLLDVRGDSRAVTISFTGDAPQGGGPATGSFHAMTHMRDGRMTASDIFDTAEEALAALRRATEAESSPALGELLQRRYTDALNARDWSAVETMIAEDVVQVDRRAMASEVGQGRDAVMTTLRGSIDVAPDMVLESRILAAADDAVAAILTFRGTTPDGGPAEVAIGYVGRFRDGVSVHNEYLEPDAEELILERFRALSGGGPALVQQWAEAVDAGEAAAPEPGPAVRLAEGVEPTALTVLYAGWTDAVNRHDVDALAAFFGEDFRHEDHRAGMRHVMQGRDEVVASYRDSFSQSPDLRIQSLVLAATDEVIRARVTFYGAGGRFEIEQEQVSVVRDGVSRSTDVYEVEDPAVTARYAAWVAHLRQAQLQQEVLSAHDWERAREEVFAEDFSQTDYRRSVGAETIRGAGNFLDHLRKTWEELVPDTTITIEVVAVEGNRRVSKTTYRGHLLDGGGEAELVLWTVAEIDGLRNVRGDIYEDEKAARAALAAPPRDQDLAGEETRSLAWQSHAELERAFNERDWAALDNVLTEDYAWADHRPGLRQELYSRAAFVDMLRTMTEGNDLRWETTAVDDSKEGGGLGRVVQRGTYRGGPYEIAFITIYLVDAERRSSRGEVFAVDDEAAARRRLDELRSPVAQAYRRLTAAFNARDWDAFGARVTDDFAWHDCRPSFLEVRHGRAAFVEWAQSAGAGDVQWTFETVEVRGRVQLARIRFAGNFRGGPYENVMYDVHTLGEDGLFVGTYAYEEAQLEEARARLEELAAEGERLESPAAWQTRSR